MAKFGEGDLVKCSFCGKSQQKVKKVIAGPGVYICDECVGLCVDILAEEQIPPFPRTAPLPATPPLIADELLKLGVARDKGLLTDEEFTRQKAKLLG